VPAKCDAHYSLFMKGMDFRESCYNCKFATIERCSDITIGDCDSAREYPKFKKGFSKSIILLNTVKAEIFWNSVKYLFDYKVLDLASEVEKNEQLRKPYDRPPTRDIIYQKISIMPYDQINRKFAMSNGYKQRLSVIFQDVLPNWLYRELLAVISRQQ